MGQIKVEHDIAGIKGLCVIEPTVHGDKRGYFTETYNRRDMAEAGLDYEFVQDNQSSSVKGVLRGLHFQIHYPQTKLVRVIRGAVYDVAVDIRPKSTTFKKYVKVELSQENKNMLFIPAGFAHGFVSLSDDVELLYKTSNEYKLQADCGILWNDKDLNIDWGIDFEPILSDKDKNQKTLRELINEGIL